jgi:hypothetical protein
LLLKTKEIFSSQEGILFILRGGAFSISMESESLEKSIDESLLMVLGDGLADFFFFNFSTFFFFLTNLFFFLGIFLFFVTDLDLLLLFAFLAFFAFKPFFLTGIFFLEALTFRIFGEWASTIPRHNPAISLIRLDVNF